MTLTLRKIIHLPYNITCYRCYNQTHIIYDIGDYELCIHCINRMNYTYNCYIDMCICDTIIYRVEIMDMKYALDCMNNPFISEKWKSGIRNHIYKQKL